MSAREASKRASRRGGADTSAQGEAHNGDIVDARRLWLPSGGSGANGLRIYDLSPLLRTPAAAPTSLLASGTVNGKNPVDLWAASPYRGNRPVGAPFTRTHDVSVYVDQPVQQADGSVALRDIVLLAEGGSYTNTPATPAASSSSTSPTRATRWC